VLAQVVQDDADTCNKCLIPMFTMF